MTSDAGPGREDVSGRETLAEVDHILRVARDALYPGAFDWEDGLRVDGVAKFAAWLAERDAAHDAQVRAEALTPVLALADDVWRVASCGCGHRADLHTNPVYPDEVALCRGHALCGCDWSFVRIVRHRLRAAARAVTHDTTEEDRT